jgi:putative glutamine amidotransferase
MAPTGPVIGISASIERARWAAWEDVPTNLSPRTYSDAVAAAGGTAVVLPPGEPTASEPDRLLDLLDGLLLAGGPDLDPASYGADPGPRTVDFNGERDRFELALARRAFERDLPVLGICRGMELLNVARGGTLVQHLEHAGTHLHTAGQFTDHDVRLERGSLASRALGADRVRVRSHHHQGVDTLGEGVVASGWADPDGIVEAIEVPEREWALGILWHAEEDRSSPVIAALTAAAGRREVAA